jgi:hypothetical protein
MGKPLDLLAKLKAFELANPSKRGPLCTVCRLPENLRAFIVEGKRQGSTLRSIAAVINSEGPYKATEYTVGRHLRDGHGAS